MPRRVDRFLRHATIAQDGPRLGRVFSVTRETWALSDDPRKVPPQAEILVSSRTASDAADLAREAAESFTDHGFHKPSGAWWGSDGVHIHRYVVHAGPRHGKAVLLGAGLAGLAGLAAVLLLRPGRKGRSNDS